MQLLIFFSLGQNFGRIVGDPLEVTELHERVDAIHTLGNAEAGLDFCG
jgi:hypothetical protein